LLCCSDYFVLRQVFRFDDPSLVVLGPRCQRYPLALKLF
jgi:hypothetical protein